MVSKQFPSGLTPDQKQQIAIILAGFKNNLPFMVNLNKLERQKTRKLGPRRVGFVMETHDAGLANPSVLPVSFNQEEFTDVITLLRDMSEIHAALKPFWDSLESTLIVLGSTSLKNADKVYGYLKIAATKNSDASLNSTVKRLSSLLKQSKKKKNGNTDSNETGDVVK